MVASEILRLVSGALQDLEPNIEPRWRWVGGTGANMNGGASGVEIGLLDFLNDAIRAICIQRPDATVITESILLEPGMRQTLPKRRIHQSSRDAVQLIELTRNMGEDGQTQGVPIVSVKTSLLLASADVNKSGKSVDNFAYDRMVNKDIYYVFPAVAHNIDVWVEASYSTSPIVVSDASQVIGISDEYAPAIKHYILSSIFAGDNEDSNMAKAQYHIQLFAQALGIKMQADMWPKAKSSYVGGI